MNIKKSILLIIVVLLIDQISKIYIKTNFQLGEEIYVFDWFRIHFIENNGAAWGTELGGKTGKLILTLFRLCAIVGIGYWLHKSIKEKAHNLLIVSISLIFTGALGNIIDSVFYGILFTDSYGQLATYDTANAYGELFHGKVVDMLYFPIWQGNLPEWLPVVGGNNFTFFNAIFNVADSAISIGVMILLFFSKTIFPKK
ncbi:lipoprotein signal peptidase [Wenyingzhuangia sp. 2_MG-2023]|uniref:lipoprotein signal peptidase n=1 Tax=Wenyingzhuangia sp. 2_MG-2023 TaxID=3062639 RepID=UPI0026E17DA0|nr:lipoprotein signal peptidase [Wenyingzhuangia sp. 2_MG-2023]MDO6737709.1 lipoprotein signal peptidase [Wenyingzhuangia sp. 2_MG-2023]MDO6802548.1 lipoprotein signal peptidase [Wenyingzhuangia sp. 1_MG-2023]